MRTPHNFFFSATATTEIYTLSLHDALPILHAAVSGITAFIDPHGNVDRPTPLYTATVDRSEEHTSELQSLTNLVCRLLLEKKKNIHICYVLVVVHIGTGVHSHSTHEADLPD